MIGQLLRRLEKALVRITPPRLRYPLLTRLARVIAAGRPPTALDTAADDALAKTLERVDRYGLTFEPRLRLENDEILWAALNAGRGVLLVSAHALLGFTVPRLLFERGIDPTLIATNPTVMLLGTGRRVESVPRSASHTRATRAALEEGRLVFTMADRWDLPPEQRVEFTTAHGRVRATPLLMQVAADVGAAVVFMMAATDATGAIRTVFAAPSIGSPPSGQSLMADYVAFVQRQTARAFSLRDARSDRRA